ncbi:MAG: ADP-ribose diphosphatase [Glaciecola sp.]
MASFGKNDVKLVKVQRKFNGYFNLNKYYFTHALFAGGHSDEVAREVFERGHAVAVLPYDPIRKELVFIEQFRYPALETSESPWLIEIVAGIIEPGEEKEDVCRREAQEEAGIELEQLLPMCSYLPSPGACTERVDLFLAKVDATTAKGIHGLDTEAEDIKVLRVGLDEAKAWLKSGKLDNSAVIIALQWLLLNHDDVLSQWQLTGK